MKICQYLRLYKKDNMPKVSNYNTFCFLRYAHPRYVKCLFTNIRKQWNTLKISLIFKKNANFAGKYFENSYDLECKIFRVLFSHERNHIGGISNLHECTFKQMLNNTLRLNFCYLKVIHILHPRYHPKIIGHILENKQNNKWTSVSVFVKLHD